jgi:hypothetical protein
LTKKKRYIQSYEKLRKNVKLQTNEYVRRRQFPLTVGRSSGLSAVSSSTDGDAQVPEVDFKKSSAEV